MMFKASAEHKDKVLKSAHKNAEDSSFSNAVQNGRKIPLRSRLEET